jgi:hypothetical protein
MDPGIGVGIEEGEEAEGGEDPEGGEAEAGWQRAEGTVEGEEEARRGELGEEEAGPALQAREEPWHGEEEGIGMTLIQILRCSSRLRNEGGTNIS